MSPNTSDQSTAETIVLIHGLWMTALSWEHWVERYQDRGFNVIARSWPGMDGDIDELRRDPSGIEHLGIEEIVDYYAGIIGELDSPPIIMGHSFGGRSRRSCSTAASARPASRSTPGPSRACSRSPLRR